jgi:hypothetical protein
VERPDRARGRSWGKGPACSSPPPVIGVTVETDKSGSATRQQCGGRKEREAGGRGGEAAEQEGRGSGARGHGQLLGILRLLQGTH